MSDSFGEFAKSSISISDIRQIIRHWLLCALSGVMISAFIAKIGQTWFNTLEGRPKAGFLSFAGDRPPSRRRIIYDRLAPPELVVTTRTSRRNLRQTLTLMSERFPLPAPA